MTTHDPHHGSGARWNRGRWALITFLAIAAYFLVTKHQAHLTGWLAAYGIWLVLLACPLLHIFMHGGHGHGGGGHASNKKADKDE